MVSCDKGLGLRWWGLHEVRDSGKRRERGLRISSDGGLCRASAEKVGEVSDSGLHGRWHASLRRGVRKDQVCGLLMRRVWCLLVTRIQVCPAGGVQRSVDWQSWSSGEGYKHFRLFSAVIRPHRTDLFGVDET